MPIIRLHGLNEKEACDCEIVTGYVSGLEADYEAGRISTHTYRSKKQAVERLAEYHDKRHQNHNIQARPQTLVTPPECFKPAKC